MNDEDAFLQAIQAAPDDHLVKLVYADWLDEHGQPEKARYIRWHVDERHPWQNPTENIGPVWRQVFLGEHPLWDSVTLLVLGRLQGLFEGLARGNDHDFDLHFGFYASLHRQDEGQALRRQQSPLGATMTELDDWRGTLRAELARWIRTEQGTPVRRGPRRAHQTPEGCLSTADRVLRLISELLTTVRGWRVEPPEQQDGLESSHFLLTGSGRALYLTFGMCD